MIDLEQGLPYAVYYLQDSKLISFRRRIINIWRKTCFLAWKLTIQDSPTKSSQEKYWQQQQAGQPRRQNLLRKIAEDSGCVRDIRDVSMLNRACWTLSGSKENKRRVQKEYFKHPEKLKPAHTMIFFLTHLLCRVETGIGKIFPFTRDYTLML